VRSLLHPFLVLTLLAAGCNGTAEKREQSNSQTIAVPQALPSGPALAPSSDDLSTTNATEPAASEASLAEPRASPTSAQGAATVVETYYALIEARNYRAAWALRWNSDAMTPEQFAAGFTDYADYHATVGAPSEIQGAAGSLYVEVPVQLYGRMKNGKPFGSAGTVTLRRVNDVPGSTAEERRWRIYSN
jgi:hypothetical protein